MISNLKDLLIEGNEQPNLYIPNIINDIMMKMFQMYREPWVWGDYVLQIMY